MATATGKKARKSGGTRSAIKRGIRRGKSKKTRRTRRNRGDVVALL